MEEYFSYNTPARVAGVQLPSGMGEAFARNPSALGSFARLTSEGRASLIKRAEGISDPDAMDAFVAAISLDNNVIG